MPTINEAFPSDFLKAEDLKGRSVTCTINNAKIEDIGQGPSRERKIIVSFVGKDKKLVCNKTNARTIGSLHGEEIDNWPGKKITLAPREVEFQGAMVWAIRVSLQDPDRVDFQQLPPMPPRVQALPPKPATVPTDESNVPF